jgi:hypothetical protein
MALLLIPGLTTHSVLFAGNNDKFRRTQTPPDAEAPDIDERAGEERRALVSARSIIFAASAHFLQI